MAILRCTSPFATWLNGVPRVVANDELVDSTDPVVKGRESHFVPVEQAVTRRVEQATAAPGEARTVSTTKRATKSQK